MGTDDRTLHEVYLWPFAEGVRAGVGAVMTAYNAVCAHVENYGLLLTLA